MTDLKLYEIAPALHDALSAEEFNEETISDLSLAFEEKAAGIIRFSQKLDGFVEMAKAEEKRIAERRRAAENRRDSILSYLKRCMEVADITKLTLGTATASLQANPPKVVVHDEESIPARFVKIVQTTSIDKTGIRDAIKHGEAVPGCELVQEFGLRIR